jgi:hypothetical protein
MALCAYSHTGRELSRPVPSRLPGAGPWPTGMRFRTRVALRPRRPCSGLPQPANLERVEDGRTTSRPWLASSSTSWSADHQPIQRETFFQWYNFCGFPMWGQLALEVTGPYRTVDQGQAPVVSGLSVLVGLRGTQGWWRLPCASFVQRPAGAPGRNPDRGDPTAPDDTTGAPPARPPRSPSTRRTIGTRYR